MIKNIKKLLISLTIPVMLALGTGIGCASYLDESMKNYGISADNMFLTSLSVLNALNYEILEMQSSSGYILFRTGAKDYILSVTPLSEVTSIVKILPANSVFSTGSTVQKTIFTELDTNKLNILKKQG